MTTPETLTWDEIRHRYPDEYMVLIDTEVDRDTDVLTGTVVIHGKGKREMRQYLGTLSPRSGACLWTGTPGGLLGPMRQANPK